MSSHEKTARPKSLWVVLKCGSVECLFFCYTTSLGSCVAPVEVFPTGRTVKRHCNVSSCVPARMLPVYLLTLTWPKSIRTG